MAVDEKSEAPSTAPAVQLSQQQTSTAPVSRRITCELGSPLLPGQRIVELTLAECDAEKAKVDQKEHDRNKELMLRIIAENQQAEERKKHEKEAAAIQSEKDRENGYRPISFEDFMLDGKEIASAEQKVSVSGVYIRMGQVDFLMPSIVAVGMARENGRFDQAIVLLIDDAPREARRGFLACRNDLTAGQVGCIATTILGHVVMCDRTTLAGHSTIPCIVVDEVRGGE